MMVIDLWHSKCVKCPAALDKLNDFAGSSSTSTSSSSDDVLYVSCALSQGPGNIDLACEMVADTWENLTHVFMEVEVKEEAKALFGFNAVPFVIVVDKDGNVIGHGDPKTVDYAALVAGGAAAAAGASAPLVLDEDF
jgi:hypothetical protein